MNLSAFLIITKPVLSESVLEILFMLWSYSSSHILEGLHSSAVSVTCSLFTSACYQLEQFIVEERVVWMPLSMLRLKWCQDKIPQQCLWEAACSWPPSIWLDYTGWNLLILSDCVVYMMVTLRIVTGNHSCCIDPATDVEAFICSLQWLKIGFHFDSLTNIPQACCVSLSLQVLI